MLELVLVVLTLTLPGCTLAGKLGIIDPPESPKHRLARERHERDALLDKCKEDWAEYFRNMKPPVLKSCLSYLTQLKEGVKDAAADRQCSTDLFEELASCREWKSVSEREIMEARLRGSGPGLFVCSTFGDTTICN